MPRRVMWFRARPAAGRPSGAARRRRRRARRRRAAVRPRPDCWGPAGDVRRAYLLDALLALDERIGGLHVRPGDPAEVVPAVAPRRRGGRASTSTRRLRRRTGSGATRCRRARRSRGTTSRWCAPARRYAVAPGRVTQGRRHALPRLHAVLPRVAGARLARTGARRRATVPWLRATRATVHPRRSSRRPDVAPPARSASAAALERWSRVPRRHVDDYADRARPARTSTRTSRCRCTCSGARSIRARCSPTSAERALDGARARRELAWREFYADVAPPPPRLGATATTTCGYRGRWTTTTPAERLRRVVGRAAPATRSSTPACASSLAEGWMHNRVRMVVASLPGQGPAPGLDARRALLHATCCATATSPSNQHGWQWVAGSGTDAAPYFRVFNPVTQGLKFDPDGDYVRRWVPELRRRPGRSTSTTPWKLRRAAGRLPGADRRPRRGAGRVAAPLRGRQDRSVGSLHGDDRGTVQRSRPLGQRRLRRGHARRRGGARGRRRRRPCASRRPSTSR